MTPQDLAELKRRLADYRAAKHPPARALHRMRLETFLVRHAEDLIAAAEASQVGVPVAALPPAPAHLDMESGGAS
jgi:hypothetical protein